MLHRRLCATVTLSALLAGNLFLRSALARDVSAPAAVTPASVPIPLPAEKPLPPDRLRSTNPAVLPMMGEWRFSLVHGGTKQGVYYSRSQRIISSGEQSFNPSENAFDGDPKTRWCAPTQNYPQWIQADLGHAQRVTALALTWEKASARYTCRIQGSLDGRSWKTLSDHSAQPGIGDGPVSDLTPTEVRYVRVLVLGATEGWASISECAITVEKDGQQVIWKPTPEVQSVEAQNAFVAPDFDDRDWKNLKVPSNWEMAGYSIPTYNSVDDTVGLYRREVMVPASFAGKRILWRFDGVLDSAEIFINGKRAGYHESGYTAFDVDVTGLIKPGKKNLFAVRVCKTTTSADLDTGDYQSMGGIYRENYLIAVPQTHVEDITVRTDLDAAYKNATLVTDVRVSGTPGATVVLTGALGSVGGVQHSLPDLTRKVTFGEDGEATVHLSAPVTSPHLWSAEKPDLYYLTLQLKGGNGATIERVQQRFGFREIKVRNGILLWNGVAIKATGVCRHDFWPTLGFALNENAWRKDLALMRAANINAIRTSHYNHATRFLELCEEQGFYILDEVPYCWIDEKVADPTYLPYLLTRADETIARDKNRPCVLAWSLGNENGYGENSQKVLDRVRALDSTRPAFVSCMEANAYKGQGFQDYHYPSAVDLVHYLEGDRKVPLMISENPHTFYQKEWSVYDPGVSDLWSEALINAWDLIWPEPNIFGSFIWEWQNQGIADKNPDRTRDFWYGPDYLRQENNKGIMDAYRHPKPEWWSVKMVYSPVLVAARTVNPVSGHCSVPLTNRYSFTDLKELTCRWTALSGTRTLQSGTIQIACAPGRSTDALFPAPVGMTALRLEFLHPDTGTSGSTSVSVISALLSVPGKNRVEPPAALVTGTPLTIAETAGQVRISNSLGVIAFDKKKAALLSWRVGGRDLITGNPILNLGTELAAGSAPKDTVAGVKPPTVENATLATMRMGDTVQVTTTGSVYTATKEHAYIGTLVCHYLLRRDATIAVRWQLHWRSDSSHAWEIGLNIPVSKQLSRMRWARDSYFTDYPAGHIGAPSGECSASDIVFRSSKRDLHWLSLTDSKGKGGLLLQADERMPLIGRAAPGATGTLLIASREEAGPHDLSWSYIANHDIVLTPGTAIFGSFTLQGLR